MKNLIMLHLIDDPKLFSIFSNPYYWRKKSEEMKKTGDLLKVEMDRQRSYLNSCTQSPEKINLDILGPMIGETCFAMYGFSIELILKAVIVWKKPSYTSNGTVSGKLKTHYLTELCSEAGYSLTPDEKIFCETATRFMLQFRYPVPNKMSETQYDNKVGNFFDVYKNMYDNLFALIKGFNHFGHDEDRCPQCSKKITPSSQ